jgi:hypothetical protein
MTFSSLPDSFLLMMSGHLSAPPLGCLSSASTWCHYVSHVPLWKLKPVPFGSGPQTYLGTAAFSRLTAANTWFHGRNHPKVLPRPYFPASALLRTADLLEAYEIASLTATCSRVFKIVQPTITRNKWFTVPVCACHNCRPPWATNARMHRTIRRPGGTFCLAGGWRVTYYAPESDTESNGSMDSMLLTRSATNLPVTTDEETAVFPDPAQLWNQMMSHRGENGWDLLAAVWSYLGCRPPATASRYTYQMVTATTVFLGQEEITRLESRVNTVRNINDLPWWPADLREEWTRLNNVYTTAPATPCETPPDVSP